MRVLVLGGTKFIGRHYAYAAMRAGHAVTLFHRGTLGVGSVEGAADILGDRTKDLHLLAGQTWDLVMDSSGYKPGVVRDSARALQNSCGRYLFVSTVSVYQGSGEEAIREDSEKVPIGDPDAQEVTGETYGYLKVLCEQEIESAYGARGLIVRPGIVAGSYDPTNRFTYWVMRFAGGDDVLTPDVRESRLQLIDVRDLTEFMVAAGDADLTGVFNTAGPHSTFGSMIETCRGLNPEANAVWVSKQQLESLRIEMGSDLPLATVPPDDKLFDTSSARAAAKGLRYRTLEDTAQDVMFWKGDSPEDAAPGRGMSREREIEALGKIAEVG
jgi:2'-hydroxyisoflavone reductase